MFQNALMFGDSALRTSEVINDKFYISAKGTFIVLYSKPAFAVGRGLSKERAKNTPFEYLL